jgi:hypothetical protein
MKSSLNPQQLFVCYFQVVDADLLTCDSPQQMRPVVARDVYLTKYLALVAGLPSAFAVVTLCSLTPELASLCKPGCDNARAGTDERPREGQTGPLSMPLA